ncbi:MAG: Spx/MgsR family RNA polymerase-binding regulatory protein [Pseudomonadota bacterium]|nr:Spx/MgsR family RNA polymerase-binding regulatory protein [Pseudomonadota bacterium]
MTLTVYGIRNCDSMKQAFQWLKAKGVTYNFVDFKKEPPSADVVEAWLEGVGDALVNTRGPSYRQLPDIVKNQFTGRIRIQAIVDKPTLIKRPLMVNGHVMTVGFHPDQWITIPNLLKA